MAVLHCTVESISIGNFFNGNICHCHSPSPPVCDDKLAVKAKGDGVECVVSPSPPVCDEELAVKAKRDGVK